MALTEIDRSLLKRCIAEEAGAWQDFVDRFIGLFIHVVNHAAHSRSVRLRPDDVDDLCAEIFVRLLADDCRALRAFEGHCSLATYLAVIARRIVVRQISQRRMAEAFGHVQAHQTSLERAQATHSEYQRIENEEEVRQLLRHLPAMDAAVVKQFHLEGKSYREISTKLGISENAIGPTLSRARDKMRKRKVRS